MRFALLALILAPVALFANEPERADSTWWSLQPLRSVAPPNTPNARHPIDAFLLAKLREHQLSFAPEADRLTLIRRLTFDLTGLPPTPEEIDAFVNDRSLDAYEKLVDRLLASPRYGERWGRHWLDIVRFGESDGFERDKLRDFAYPYRDYVVRSFNQDKPYGRFVREQIAGDAEPKPTRDGIIATGILVAGPFDEVAASTASLSVKLQARQDELEDMLAVVGQTFLGLTVNCARCHDHKFDPIDLKDYYSMQAVFAGVRPGTRDLLTPDEQRERTTQIQRLQEQIAALQRDIASLEEMGRKRARPQVNGDIPPAPIARWSFDTDGKDSIGKLHATFQGEAKIEKGRLVVSEKSGFARTAEIPFALKAKTLEVWVSLDSLDQRGGGVISIETPNGQVFDAIVFGEREPRKWMAGSNGFVRTRDLDAKAEDTRPGELIHIAITYTTDDRITVYRNGEVYGTPYQVPGGNGVPSFPISGARILFGLRHTGGGNARFNGGIDEARLYNRALTHDEIKASLRSTGKWVSVEQARESLNADERGRLVKLEFDITGLQKRIQDRGNIAKTYAGTRLQPEAVHVLNRGNLNKKLEQVSAGGLPAIQGLKADWGLAFDAPEAQRRLKFAEWLTDERNPLPWRVIVNRVWQHHFGRGLVGSSSDFGLNGDRPSHPELLDFLASEFLRSGQSIKALHRLILTSSAYRQSARFDAKAVGLDADHRLLWRFQPRRLDAEAVRDAMLFVSGRMNEQMEGPSFRPFKTVVFNANFYELFDSDDPMYLRRTIYRMNVNSARDPLLESLDCPDPSTKTPRRSQTTTPIQSLGLMNGYFMQRQSIALAERVQREAGDDVTKQVDRVYRLTLGREPRPDERNAAVALVRKNGLRELCWVLFNASEFVYVR